MKKITYQTGRNENVGSIPNGAEIEVYCLAEGTGGDALIYFPPTTRWREKGSKRWKLDKGSGSLSFAWFSDRKGVWIESKESFIDLSNKQSNLLERAFKGKD